jgi:hypothetical protein
MSSSFLSGVARLFSPTAFAQALPPASSGDPVPMDALGETDALTRAANAPPFPLLLVRAPSAVALILQPLLPQPSADPEAWRSAIPLRASTSAVKAFLDAAVWPDLRSPGAGLAVAPWLMQWRDVTQALAAQQRWLKRYSPAGPVRLANREVLHALYALRTQLRVQQRLAASGGA